MSSHNSIYEEIKEQHQKTKDMSLMGKLGYFWYYYKIHTVVVIAVLAFTIMFIKQYRANKDYAFYAILINADTSRFQVDQWNDEFAAYARIDTEEYRIYIDTSFVYDTNTISEYTISIMEQMLALISSGTVDVIIADTDTFENQAQNEYYVNLSVVLPKEVLDQYSDYLYYTDAASFETIENAPYSDNEPPNPDTFIIDHHDPSSMEQPIPVGICLPKGNKLIETGCYDYIAENHMTYQGYPSEVVLGIPVTSTHIDTVIQFLKFLE